MPPKQKKQKQQLQQQPPKQEQARPAAVHRMVRGDAIRDDGDGETADHTTAWEEVQLHPISATRAWVCDTTRAQRGGGFVRAAVTASNYDVARPGVVRVTGYVTSRANGHHLPTEPALCLTDFEYLMGRAKTPQDDPEEGRPMVDNDGANSNASPPLSSLLQWNNNNANTNAPSGGGRVPGGKVVAFLRDVAPRLSLAALAGSGCAAAAGADDSLAGGGDDATAANNPQQHQQRLQTVSNFLSHHQAMRTLQQTTTAAASADENNKNNKNNNQSSSSSSSSNHNASLQLYLAVLQEFQASQLDRQKASLTSNEGRETAAVAARVVQQHQAALQAALDDADSSTGANNNSLTIDKLHQWHQILCDGLVPEAGRFRTKNVRVAHTHFCPHEQVPALTQQLLQALQTLEERVFSSNSSNSNNNNKTNAIAIANTTTTGADTAAGATSGTTVTPALRAVTRAAAVFMGLIDCHPYADGNGRLARLAANWTLRRHSGLPFCLHWFATPAQRAAYSLAIRQTRRNLTLVGVGLASCENDAAGDKLLQAHRLVGCLQPIVELLLDRLHRAVLEVRALLRERESAHHEQTEAAAARRFRERAAAGTCLICFDDRPNIATLCCGKAVHLNCMAQWLSAADSAACPQCRAALPAVPAGLRRPVPPGSSAEGETGTASLSDVNDTTTDGTTEEDDGDDNNDTTMDDDDDDEDDTTVDDTTTYAAPVPAQVAAAIQAMLDQDTTTTDDDTTTIDDTETAAPGAAAPNSNIMNMNNNADDTTVSYTDDTTTETAAAAPAPSAAPILYCQASHCRNRAALDCSNQSCGRCCLMHGSWQCRRHANGV